VLIDLDGTFVSVNTFHKWMKFLFIEELKKFHLISVFTILKIVFLRSMKKIDHSKMKFSILKISEQTMDEKQIETFVQSLHPYVNNDLLLILENDCNTTILATAAPILYAQEIQKVYNFDHVIATGKTSEIEWKENIKEEKKKNVISLLKQHNLNNERSILYTDHHDDLPLMRYSNFTYLINASEETKRLTLHESIKYKVELD